jgi:DNA transposition AAA+ family ATPase
MNKEQKRESVATCGSPLAVISIQAVINSPQEANAAHSFLQSTVQCYVELGRYLTEQKEKCEHGEWLDWIKANLEFGQRTVSD